MHALSCSRVLKELFERAANIGEAEGLRGLDPSQFLSLGCADHQAVLVARETVDDGKDRNCAGCIVKRIQELGNHGFGQVWPRGIVDEHAVGRSDGRKGARDRLLPGRPTGYQFVAGKTFERLPCRCFAIFGNRHDQRVCTGREQRLYRMTQHRLAAPHRKLLR